MRIRVLSDLHLEVSGFLPPPADADVVVLAGDVANGAAAIDWARHAFDVPVLYVPGNHEYYDGQYQAVQAGLRAAQNADPEGRVRVLDCTEWRFRGVRFLGCTLWSDYSLLPQPERAASMNRLRRYIPDYRLIRFDERCLQPEDSVALCTRHRAWLAAKLAEIYGGPTVVVTHFVPHRNSIAAKFADNFANPMFVVPMDEFMGRALLWIHGHTHTAFDYQAGGTRIVCNPRGYPDEDTGFNPGMIVEVPQPVGASLT
ncbi:MAG: serine/threonine protein phosphatase [Betaproteobacteria bacterium]|nr:serine/threonine protein phosphatase [Betaproteobacteria bacterium]